MNPAGPTVRPAGFLIVCFFSPGEIKILFTVAEKGFTPDPAIRILKSGVIPTFTGKALYHPNIHVIGDI
jgi:uroporphyrinogen-III synthase